MRSEAKYEIAFIAAARTRNRRIPFVAPNQRDPRIHPKTTKMPVNRTNNAKVRR
jgi:hypothetical protein